MRIVHLSDTHNQNEKIKVPEGDILIHSGDATMNGRPAEIAAFSKWFAALPHRHKIFVAGNHDMLFETDGHSARALLDKSIIYLQDAAVEIEGLLIYGSPWQPRFYDWAFNRDRGPEMAEKWAIVPDEIDILITHGPPNQILDAVPQTNGSIDHAGCEELRKRIEILSAAGRLKLHCFGHIHCGHGVERAMGMTFSNASICDERYRPAQPPNVIDI